MSAEAEAWTCEACAGYGEVDDPTDGYIACPMCAAAGVVESVGRPAIAWAEMTHSHWAELCRAMGIDPETGEERSREVDAIEILRRYIDQSELGPRPTVMQARQARAALALLQSERVAHDAQRRARKEASHGR